MTDNVLDLKLVHVLDSDAMYIGTYRIYGFMFESPIAEHMELARGRYTKLLQRGFHQWFKR
jgi:hypothetical protein